MKSAAAFLTICLFTGSILLTCDANVNAGIQGISRVRTVPSNDQKKKDEKKQETVKTEKPEAVPTRNTQAPERPCSQNLQCDGELIITAENRK